MKGSVGNLATGQTSKKSAFAGSTVVFPSIHSNIITISNLAIDSAGPLAVKTGYPGRLSVMSGNETTHGIVNETGLWQKISLWGPEVTAVEGTYSLYYYEQYNLSRYQSTPDGVWPSEVWENSTAYIELFDGQDIEHFADWSVYSSGGPAAASPRMVGLYEWWNYELVCEGTDLLYHVGNLDHPQIEDDTLVYYCGDSLDHYKKRLPINIVWINGDHGFDDTDVMLSWKYAWDWDWESVSCGSARYILYYYADETDDDGHVLYPSKQSLNVVDSGWLAPDCTYQVHVRVYMIPQGGAMYGQAHTEEVVWDGWRPDHHVNDVENAEASADESFENEPNTEWDSPADHYVEDTNVDREDWFSDGYMSFWFYTADN